MGTIFFFFFLELAHVGFMGTMGVQQWGACQGWRWMVGPTWTRGGGAAGCSSWEQSWVSPPPPLPCHS